MRQKVIFQDLGLTDYFDTWQYQTEIHQKLKEEKKIINNPNPSHTLIFCEHHAVFTLGRSGSLENLIVSPEYLAEKMKNAQEFKLKNAERDLIAACYYFKQYNSPWCWKSIEQAKKEYEKLKTKKDKLRYVKEQIRIHSL